ncbi:MAG TPA: sodium:proton antiporter [Planctomycetota bacterium]
MAAVDLPRWTVAPFVGYLLAIALLPLVAPKFWHSNRNKLLVALAAALPVALYLLLVPEHGGHWLVHSAKEYVAFVVLLAALYVIAGGIHLKGSLAGTPLSNTAILGIGAALASLIGTTGASMVLIRPLLRANEKRLRKAHLVIFFIFIVSNSGGLLTPLGDPPLFLGFLRGVPFLWTLNLFLPWLLVNGALLVIFNFLDQGVLFREELERPGSQLEEVQKIDEPLRLEGGLNILWLLGVIGIIYAIGAWGSKIIRNPDAALLLQVGAMIVLAGLSMATTKTEVRKANRFAWGPILEVAAIFAGIFVTMVPALNLLEAEGAGLGLRGPSHFFWATGLLSSFLDNAPTYLAFTTLGTAVVNGADPAAGLSADNLGPFAAHPAGGTLLAAISCGAVFMGAMTYIGNGPNFMVKAIAEERGVRMPGFFRYMAWSGAILLPVFAAVTLLFFR